MRAAPETLKTDAVAEALIDIQFTSDEVPEVALGRLAAAPALRGFSVARLPVADIPLAIRQGNPNLAFQPLLEARKPDGTRAARLGERISTWHCLPPYPGWQVFREEIHQNIDFLHESISGIKLSRLALKYINALSDRHGVRSVSDLELEISLAGKAITYPFNLSYIRQATEYHNVLTRVATAEWVENPSQPLSVLVDVDVSTPLGIALEGASAAKSWLEDAHEILKEEFFSFVSKPALAKMAGESGAA